ncbi:carbohydrate porin [Siccirubricoccus sp. KC 17139]|uniref:Carbohydrate porin n=1 Tax=Siccirubricoccus soli TaxID=2899147 RepID=A0ABT1D7K5_9PROT|nr:carbohydrate porin [Siccirubricoccus soli]MCO6417886.1 carbohydrate porin [Siccirubricoccus soli]MCP2684021.1 carbohydrate porin [Siccirubricoccus soli]
MRGIVVRAWRWLMRGCAALAWVLPVAPAAAQGYGSAAVANVGLPDDALLPNLAALQDRLEEQGWMLRGQATFVWQGNGRFHSPYRGEGSLSPAANARNTLSTDLILGRQLWPGAEVILDASVTRGFGLSNSVGVASFPNNEAFRLGSTEPTFFVPRAFFRQTIALSADTVEDADPLRFGTTRARERVTITLGKFSVWDIFDDNLYAHDARTQFLGWGLVGAGAFDFAADARGWTEGLAVEWEDGRWGVRLGAFRVARQANGLFLDPAITRAYQVIGQLDRFWEGGGRPGAIRLLYGLSRTRQSRWGELPPDGAAPFAINPQGYRLKHMLAANLEQEVADGVGVFARLSWNDGRTQNWMFTEMDRAVSAGLSFDGKRWDRPGDTAGLGVNIGWISAGRRRYLEAGGIGFITGDGRLNYGPETAMEAYYDWRLAPGVNLSMDAQLIVNPAYNRDRGPVPILGLRLHTAF